MIKCTCDRCSKDIANEKIVFCVSSHSIPDFSNILDYQLCKKCYDEFLKFFKEDINND